jgi:hypothetical protein
MNGTAASSGKRPRRFIGRLLHLEGVHRHPSGFLRDELFQAALYIKAGFDTGFLRHIYILAERPLPGPRFPGRPPRGGRRAWR